MLLSFFLCLNLEEHPMNSNLGTRKKERFQFLFFLVFSGAYFWFEPTAKAITWETQADRLQNVSATLLDAVPIFKPIDSAVQVGYLSNISFLPKINPKVGAKSEKVPSSPVHTVPSLDFGGVFSVPGNIKLGGGFTLGYLPAGTEKLLGLKTKISEELFGGQFQTQWLFSDAFGVNVGGGYQQTKSKAKGPIASHTGSDTFDAKTKLYWGAIAADFRSVGLWAGVQAGLKNTESRLTIEEDDTDLHTTDKLEDASLPVWSQATLGWRASGGGIWFALSELVVPARLYMTRLSLGYDFGFLNDANGAAQDEKSGLRAKKSKKVRKSKKGKETGKGASEATGGPGTEGAGDPPAEAPAASKPVSPSTKESTP